MSNQLTKLRFNHRFYLILGIAAAVLVGIGEYLLHFHPDGPQGEIEMLLNIPLERARLGHFFSIVGVPFYFAGYYGLLKLFKRSHEFYAKCLFISGVLSFTFGGIWISSRYIGAVVLQKFANTESYEYLFTAYEENYQVLVWALRILVLLLSFFYIMSIAKNKLGIPKWLAFFNPIVLLVLVLSTLAWAKPLGVHVAPIAMNTTHVIFFLLVLFHSKNIEHKTA